jgi:hypothetical protein
MPFRDDDLGDTLRGPLMLLCSFVAAVQAQQFRHVLMSS